MDIGVYPIHVGMRLFGRPKVIKALCTKLSNGFEGDGMVMMQYDGLLVEAVYSKITQSVNQSVFLGEKGAILLDSVGKPSKMEIHYRNGDCLLYTSTILHDFFRTFYSITFSIPVCAASYSKNRE